MQLYWAIFTCNFLRAGQGTITFSRDCGFNVIGSELRHILSQICNTVFLVPSSQRSGDGKALLTWCTVLVP